MGHIRDMAVKRADSLQFETVELRTQIDNILKLIANAKLPPGSLDHQVFIVIYINSIPLDFQQMQFFFHNTYLKKYIGAYRVFKSSCHTVPSQQIGDLLDMYPGPMIHCSTKRHAQQHRLVDFSCPIFIS